MAHLFIKTDNNLLRFKLINTQMSEECQKTKDFMINKFMTFNLKEE